MSKPKKSKPKKDDQDQMSESERAFWKSEMERESAFLGQVAAGLPPGANMPDLKELAKKKREEVEKNIKELDD